MFDLSGMSIEQLKNLQTEINGELAKRSGTWIDVRYKSIPRGGAIFYDRPAIGGDRNEDLWFPSLEAANAHLVRLAGEEKVVRRKNGTLYCEYTAPGCSLSDMETRLNP